MSYAREGHLGVECAHLGRLGLALAQFYAAQGLHYAAQGLLRSSPSPPTKTKKTAQNLNENLPNRAEPSKKYIFCSGLGVSRATQPPQILCKLAPPKTKSNGLTAAPRRKPFLVRFAPASWKRADSGPGSGSQFLNPRGATT